MYEVLAENIFRQRGKMSQGELARRARVSRETVSAIENKKSINVDSLIKIAEALNIHPGDLFRSSIDERKFFDRIEAFIELKIEKVMRRVKNK
jgi:transcriptional regulator with XRE-family HTH domain